MRVLVTGWAGYVGPHVLAALGEHFPTGLDAGYYLHDYAAPPWFPTVAHFGDIRSARVPGPFDVVVHMAGLSNDPIAELAPIHTRTMNYTGTLRQIEQHSDAHHVVLSSCSVYGSATMATEDTAPNPLTEYARSKADVDGWLAAAGLSYTSLRPGTVYGYSRGHRIDLVVNRMAFDAVTVGHVTVTGNAARPLSNVQDVAAAIAWAVHERPQGVFNIVGENRRVTEVGQIVANAADVPRVFEEAGSDARDYFASGEKAASAGFAPTRTVEGTIGELLARTRRLPTGRYYERLPIARGLLVTGGGWQKVAA